MFFSKSILKLYNKPPVYISLEEPDWDSVKHYFDDHPFAFKKCAYSEETKCKNKDHCILNAHLLMVSNHFVDISSVEQGRILLIGTNHEYSITSKGQDLYLVVFMNAMTNTSCEFFNGSTIFLSDLGFCDNIEDLFYKLYSASLTKEILMCDGNVDLRVIHKTVKNKLHQRKFVFDSLIKVIPKFVKKDSIKNALIQVYNLFEIISDDFDELLDNLKEKQKDQKSII